MYHTIAEIKTANKAAGHHWFDEETIAFFDSEYYGPVYGEGLFVSSEKGSDGVRLYSVRRADEQGRVMTVGKFQGYPSLREARKAARLATTQEADRQIAEFIQ